MRASIIERVGAEDIELASTGHDKQNVSVGLAYCQDGTKLKPMIVFKGKGCTKEDEELLKRNDILVTYSDNGWYNQGLSNNCPNSK